MGVIVYATRRFVGFPKIWVLPVCLLVLLLSGCASVDGNQARGTAVADTLRTMAPQVAETQSPPTDSESATVVTGAASLVAQDFARLKGQRIGLLVNQASLVGDQHLIDMAAKSANVELVALFAPEHGIRGSAGAGEQVENEVDERTGISVFSLYGATRKPSPVTMAGIDTLVFDLQDVGTRYYTYISTLGLAMQAAAEANVNFVVLDRPNPLGGETISGFTPTNVDSFISQYPIPSVYGLTAGELANAIVAEAWLPGLNDLNMTVVQMQGWRREYLWNDTGLTWTAPSPGLPTAESALVYPATVLFEATTLSYGQGTAEPFLVIGAEWLDASELSEILNRFELPGVSFGEASFTPKPNEVNPKPRLEGRELSGVRVEPTGSASLDATTVGLYLLAAVQAQATASGRGNIVDNPGLLDLLVGSTTTRTQIADVELGTERSIAEAIKSDWQGSAEAFAVRREPYLLYA